MKTFSSCLLALDTFVAQRSGISFADYGNRDNFMEDYRPIIQQGKDYRKMASFVTQSSITDYDLIKACDQVFSGRLQFDTKRAPINGHTIFEYSVNYCTGQYFPTEYRLAACWVISRVIRNYWLACGYSYPEIKVKAKQVFGRGLALRYFN